MVSGCLVLMVGMGTQALAVWPPSTAFQEEAAPILYRVIVIAFVVGLIVGVWSMRKRNEHK